MNLWLSIGQEGCMNYGNRIIETSIRKILNEPKTVDISLWRLKDFQIPKDTTNIIAPGSTILGLPEFYEFLKIVPDHINVYIIGGCFWQVSNINRNILKIYEKRNIHIGIRDNYTSQILKDFENAKFIGCPTLWYNTNIEKNNMNIFSFGRQVVPSTFWDRDLSKLTIILHEQSDLNKVPKMFSGKIIDINNTNSHEVIKIYQNADSVITGRLHGFLPSAGRTKTTYFGDISDTRNSLLSLIGLKMSDINNIEVPSMQIPQKPKDFDKFIEDCKISLSE